MVPVAWWQMVSRLSQGLCLTLILSLSGCESCAREAPEEQGGDDDRLAIGRIDTSIIAYDHEGERFQLDVPIDDLLRQELRGAKALRSIEREEPTARRTDPHSRLKVSANLSIDGFTHKLHARVKARLTGTGSIPLEVDLDAVRHGPEGAQGEAITPADYRAHLEETLRAAMTELDEQALMLRSGNASLIEALAARDPNVKLAAIRALGDRHATEAVEPLCAALEGESDKLAPTIIDSLAQIGDEKGAHCLIEWAGTDEGKLALSLEPIATIGGDEARAYLESIAEAHGNPGLKRVAEEALRKMSGRGVRDAGP